jgi:hypothetical protein
MLLTTLPVQFSNLVKTVCSVNDNNLKKKKIYK